MKKIKSQIWEADFFRGPILLVVDHIKVDLACSTPYGKKRECLGLSNGEFGFSI